MNPLDGIIFDLNWYKNFHKPKIFFSQNRPNIPGDFFNYINDLELKFFEA